MITGHQWLLWQPLHEGFPGMGRIAYTSDGNYFTIRPSTNYLGFFDLRWWRADQQQAQLLATTSFAAAIKKAAQVHVTYTLSASRDKYRDEMQTLGGHGP